MVAAVPLGSRAWYNAEFLPQLAPYCDAILRLGYPAVRVLRRFGDTPPGPESTKRGDEARQLAWRLWRVAPAYTWLIGPGRRTAYRTRTDPLSLVPHDALPPADELGLAAPPTTHLSPPDLRN